MALVLTLKPGERAVLGTTVVRNGGKHSTRLLIETPVPVLRASDILSADDIHTPCERLYMALQLLYVDGAKEAEYSQVYLGLTQAVLTAAPSLSPLLAKIGLHVAAGEYYQALQQAKHLLRDEQALLHRSPGANGTGNA